VSAQWFYRRDGLQFGPVSSRKLYRMVQRGEIAAGDMLWREGMTEWRPAGESKTLFGSPQDREKRRQRRPAAATSRRRAPAGATAAPETEQWIGQRPLLTAIGIGVGAGLLISAILSAMLIRFDRTPREEMDATAPVADMPAAADAAAIPVADAAAIPVADAAAIPAADAAANPATEQPPSEASSEPQPPPTPVRRPRMRKPGDDF